MSQKSSNVFNNEDSNTSSNVDFEAVLQMRMNRRNILKRTAGIWGTGALASMGIVGCASSNSLGNGVGNAVGNGLEPTKLSSLGFKAVPKHLIDTVSVPEGYKA